MQAIHGVWCNARTWPTKCPGCNAAVFFFHCDCGSKVFFDDLGGCWPIHDCNTSWANNLIRNNDGKGGITVEISEGITVRRPSEIFDVEEKILNKAKKYKTSKSQDPIVTVKPEGTRVKITVVGLLREIILKADIKKTLKLPTTSTFASAFLGAIDSQPLGKITIHEPSSSNNILHSYTVWIPREFLTTGNNTKGVTVWAEISPVLIPSFGEVWYCEYYEVLG